MNKQRAPILAHQGCISRHHLPPQAVGVKLEVSLHSNSTEGWGIKHLGHASFVSNGNWVDLAFKEANMPNPLLVLL
jgi:hypothetical protein